MRKIDQYRRGMELCFANAAKAPLNELRAIWQTLGNSYAFLAELECSPGLGFGSVEAAKPALSAQRLNERPTGDRIHP